MMKLVPEFIVALLWGIAAAATAILTSAGGEFTYLGPLFAVCAIGSVLTVRWSRSA
jgi:hypothetical protein